MAPLTQEQDLQKALVKLTPASWSDLGLPEVSVDCKKAKKLKLKLVFWVHGTVGSTLALKNPFKVFSDQDLSHEWIYKIVRQGIRQNLRVHYDTSACYDEGLFRVNLDSYNSSDHFFDLGIFPIVSTYKKIFKETMGKFSSRPIPANEPEVHYSFGWSGILSGFDRRKAGLALRNAVCNEISVLKEYYKERQLEVEFDVQVNAHSHGGNVVLLAGAVDRLARGLSIEEFYKNLGHAAYCQQAQLKALIVSDFNKNSIYPMDDWLFKPTLIPGVDYLFDRAVILGCPIQPETISLAACPEIGKVWSLYSQGDMIQVADFFSTSKNYSLRLLDSSLVKKHLSGKLCQVEIAFPKLDIARATVAQFFSGIFGQGPSHLELWMITHSGRTRRFCIRPMPLVCAWPILEQLLDQDECCQKIIMGKNWSGQTYFDTYSNYENDYNRVIAKALISKDQIEFFLTDIARQAQQHKFRNEKNLGKIEKIYSRIMQFALKSFATS